MNEKGVVVQKNFKPRPFGYFSTVLWQSDSSLGPPLAKAVHFLSSFYLKIKD